MTKLTRRVLGRASVLMLAVVLALGTTVPAFANDDDGSERRGFSGIVTEVDMEAETMTVATEDGESLTATITGDTPVRLPSAEIEVQSVSDVEFVEGATRVAILAQVAEDGSLTAIWILVKPEQPQVEHLLGTVISIEGTRITIMDAQGNEHTVEVPEQALQGLQMGDVTTLVVGRPGDDGDEDESLVAHAAVTARQIQERVAAHAEVLRQRVQNGDVPVDDTDERILFLSELMDIIEVHVEGVLTIVLEKVPPQAKAAIERAREQVRIGFEQARTAIQQQGPPEDNGKPEGAGPSDNDNTSDNGKPEWAGPPGGGSGDDEEPEE